MLNVRYDYNDSARMLRVFVDQTQRDSSFTYRLPLKTLVLSGVQRKLVDWTLEKRHEVFEYPYTGTERPVIVPDYHHWLVGTLREDKKNEQWLVQFNRSDDFMSKRTAMQQAFNNKNDAALEIFKKAMQDPSPLIRSYAFEKLGNLSEGHKWIEQLRPQVLYAAEHDANNLARAAALDLLGEWQVRNAAELMVRSLDDSSYAVAGAALGALGEVDTAQAYRLARTLSTMNSRGRLESSVWKIIAREGRTEDLPLLEQHRNSIHGTQALSFATSMQRYLLKTKDSVALGRAVQLMKDIARGESIPSYRYYVATQLSAAGMGLKSEAEKAPAAEKAGKQRLYELVLSGLQDIGRAEQDKETKEEMENLYKVLK